MNTTSPEEIIDVEPERRFLRDAEQRLARAKQLSLWTIVPLVVFIALYLPLTARAVASGKMARRAQVALIGVAIAYVGAKASVRIRKARQYVESSRAAFDDAFSRANRTLSVEAVTSVQRALAETAAWCLSRKLVAGTEESEEVRRRRELLVKAGDLYRKFKIPDPKSAEWQQAHDMWEEADPKTLVFLAHQLRSEELRPAVEVLSSVKDLECEEIVQHLIEARSALVPENDILQNSSIDVRRDGQILIYEPYENVADEASEYSSNGFFRGDDAPPWDTWFHYDDRKVFCWIPSILTTLAQKGIDANLVDCIRWAKPADVRHLGL